MKKKNLFHRVNFFNMEEKISQDNAIEAVETAETVEPTDFAVNILSSETESDTLICTKAHRKNITRIIIPQYIDDQYVKDNNYVVTYSEQDNSILGWNINIEENGQQQPDVYFNFDQEYSIDSFVLYKKTLCFCYYTYHDYKDNCKYLF